MAKIINNTDLDETILKDMSIDEIDWIYNALDCCVTHEVHGKQIASMTNETAHTAAFSHSLMPAIFEMSLRGMLVDLDARQQAVKEYEQNYHKVREQLIRIVEDGIGFKPFNPQSPKQLIKLFYGVMDLKPIKARNSKGYYAPTVNRDALEKLQKYWIAIPLCNHLLSMRELKKKLDFVSTDLDLDGRMRASFNIAGTNTGRLSSSSSDYGTGTNQQNIERPLRKMFIPDPQMKMCNVDLEQADARNVGAILWDLFVEKFGEEFAGKYLDACESGDLHTFVCKTAWTELDWDGVNDRKIADQIAYRTFSYRDLSKKLGHGTNYYGTPRTMAAHTKVVTSIIEQFQRNYFSLFPAIGAYDKKDHTTTHWHNWVRKMLIEYGSITTPHFLRSRNFYGRETDDRTLREAIAYAPQSMTADEIDTGLRQLWRADIGVHPLNQVHDSINFQYPENQEETIIPKALDLLKVEWDLKKGRHFTVPLEAKVGWNWADASADNEAGLIKWKGEPDARKRPKQRTYHTSSDFKTLFNV